MSAHGGPKRRIAAADAGQTPEVRLTGGTRGEMLSQKRNARDEPGRKVDLLHKFGRRDNVRRVDWFPVPSKFQKKFTLSGLAPATCRIRLIAGQRGGVESPPEQAASATKRRRVNR